MSISAQDFVLAMEKVYGENIFKAIVEGHDERYLPDLQRFKEDAARMMPTDFQYPISNQPPSAMGVGSGKGAVAGKLNHGPDPELVMTKAPWVK